jgi:ferric-dicitrate binding protein FerR (iron transport regulator)
MENIRVGPVWSKSKEDIWNDVFEHLGERDAGKPFLRKIPSWGYAIVLIVSAGLAACFYTVTEEAARGEHSAVRLPDHSTVMLNAESKISYKPYGWLLSRTVTLEGEACFEVKPGSRFSVQSGRNRRVNVLGTTFNVYARPEMYRVTCLSGRVEVSAGREVTALSPDMQATCRGGAWDVGRNAVSGEGAGWIRGQFAFVEMPLPEVIAEIERQYDIHVTSDAGLNHIYTGHFFRTEKPEDVLQIIGKPFGITFNIE